jgi:hypothetical protein
VTIPRTEPKHGRVDVRSESKSRDVRVRSRQRAQVGSEHEITQDHVLVFPLSQGSTDGIVLPIEVV